MNNVKNKIAILIVYFGKWPQWISYFLDSASKNPSIDFLIISDSSPLHYKYSNIAFYKQTIDNLCSLINSRLGINIVLQDPYKLCDFKPTYGFLFADYLASYDYWGYCDVDLLFGTGFQKFILEKVQKHDIILGYQDFSSGPFTLFRNSREVNLIFTNVVDYQNILTLDTCQGFDEHIIKSQNEGFSLKKLIFLFLFVLRKPKYIMNFRILKYRFQWYYKRNTVTQPVDLSEVLFMLQKKKKLNVGFYPLITNDIDYMRKGESNWEVFYKNGELFDNRNQLLSIFHFGKIKKLKDFQCEVIEFDGTSGLIINEKGIRVINE